jgi:hypothetical protein
MWFVFFFSIFQPTSKQKKIKNKQKKQFTSRNRKKKKERKKETKEEKKTYFKFCNNLQEGKEGTSRV